MKPTIDTTFFVVVLAYVKGVLEELSSLKKKNTRVQVFKARVSE